MHYKQQNLPQYILSNIHYNLHENRVDFVRKWQGFVKKMNIVYLKQAWFPRIAIFVYVQFYNEKISDWFRGTILRAGFLWGTLIGQHLSKLIPGLIEYGKNFFTETERSAKWAQLWVKSIIWNFVWICWKTVSLMRRFINLSELF